MFSRLRSPLAPVLAAVALTAALAACGGGDDATGTATTTAPAGGSATTTPSDGSVTDVTLVPATQASVPSVVPPSSPPQKLAVTKVKDGSGRAAANGDILVL